MQSHRPDEVSKLSQDARKLRKVLQHGLPLSEVATKDVVKAIKACSAEELAALGLEPPPAPTLGGVLLSGSSSSSLPMAQRLQTVQDVISGLQYNHGSSCIYNVCKQRPLSAILATAAEILRDPLPIKCIEAVFLGLLLTQGWSGLQRIPVGFKSRGANGLVYRHIVLAVAQAMPSGQQAYGALGLSRRSELMFKPLQFASLAELVADFQAGYRHWRHQLLKVRVGLPVEHDSPRLHLPVCWRYCTVSPQKRSWASVAAVLNQHAAAADTLQQQYRTAAAAAAAGTGSRPHGSGVAGGSPSSSSSASPVLQARVQAVRPRSRGVLSSSIDIGSMARPKQQALGTAAVQQAGSSLVSAAAGAMLSPRYSSRFSSSSTAGVGEAMQRCGGACSERTGCGSQLQQQVLAVQQQQMQPPAPTSSGIACSDCGGRLAGAAGDDGGCCWDDCDSDSEVNVIVASMRRSPSPLLAAAPFAPPAIPV